MKDETRTELIKAALDARQNSYAPYSGYRVGAALLAQDGEIITGCNVENASYGASCCAERTALFKAVSQGKRRFLAIAVAGGRDGGSLSDYAYPCGICRQVLSEFAGKEEFQVIVARSVDDYREFTLEGLLPCGFGGDSIR